MKNFVIFFTNKKRGNCLQRYVSLSFLTLLKKPTSLFEVALHQFYFHILLSILRNDKQVRPQFVYENAINFCLVKTCIDWQK
jgi:hypothetical protein